MNRLTTIFRLTTGNEELRHNFRYRSDRYNLISPPFYASPFGLCELPSELSWRKVGKEVGLLIAFALHGVSRLSNHLCECTCHEHMLYHSLLPDISVDDCNCDLPQSLAQVVVQHLDRDASARADWNVGIACGCSCHAFHI